MWPLRASTLVSFCIISAAHASELSVQPPLPSHYGVLLFSTFQLIDVAGPIDLLTVLSWSQFPMKLSLIANENPVSNDFTRPRPHNNHTFVTSVVPHFTLADAPADIDVLIVPGGLFTMNSAEVQQPYVDFIKQRYPSLQYIISVCTGAGLLARSGILDGHRATTNKRRWNDTTSLGPDVEWVRQARWVQDGNIWTTSGMSAGIDGTFAFIESLYGKGVADDLAKGFEYVRPPNSSYDPFA